MNGWDWHAILLGIAIGTTTSLLTIAIQTCLNRRRRDDP